VFSSFDFFGAGVELFREQKMGDSQLRKFCAGESAKEASYPFALMA
jgi:hypothetical protein